MPDKPERSLLDFPMEIRTMIYKSLLSQTEAISSSSEAHLHPAIIGTCQQIELESRYLLYKENTFKIKICHRYGKLRAALMGADHIGENPFFVPGFRFKSIRRLEITVQVQDKMELWNIQAAVRKVSLALTQIRRLEYVHLRLESKDEIYTPKACFILQNFGLLRRVENVTTEGIDCMYGVLEIHTGAFGFNALLQRASEATLMSNVPMFKNYRTMIVRRLNSGMEELIRRLYEHDEQSKTSPGLGNRPAIGLLSLEDKDNLKNDSKDDATDDESYETADEGED
ncbi:hypothetical protein EDB81DRAFT_874731 [Dactylonectria macrodidyma]|uniref:Uncharacterized protein n=1 Tax=Dactylonectria macrodidyma TaxID=307937 RepID=A0A9P9FRQ7_9HYPO|nr:hypothetical protein EDB81DRAFT_874731 [Dactylonectria macrodidyma]